MLTLKFKSVMAYLDIYLDEHLQKINKEIARRIYLLGRMNPKIRKAEREMIQPEIDLHDELEELINSRKGKSISKESVLNILIVKKRAFTLLKLVHYIVYFAMGWMLMDIYLSMFC